MQEILVFENYEVEVFELNGRILFNPYHVGVCVELSDSAVRMAVGNMNEKQVVKVKNSDVKNIDFRKLNNAGENFLTESGVYKLVFKSRKPNAEKFTDWVTDEVLPTLRKTGTYSMAEKQTFEVTQSSINQALEIMDNAMEKDRQRQIGRLKYLIDSELEAELGETQSIAAIFTLLSNTGKQNVRVAMGRTVNFLG